MEDRGRTNNLQSLSDIMHALISFAEQEDDFLLAAKLHDARICFADRYNQVQPRTMDTLAGRLDYLASNYLLFLGPLLLLQGVGHATSPVIIWVSAALIVLLLVNKLHATWRSDRTLL